MGEPPRPRRLPRLSIRLGLGLLASWLASRARLLPSPIGGLISVVSSLIGMLIGVIFARIVAEYVLIIFRINEHLGAIRNRGGM